MQGNEITKAVCSVIGCFSVAIIITLAAVSTFVLRTAPLSPADRDILCQEQQVLLLQNQQQYSVTPVLPHSFASLPSDGDFLTVGHFFAINDIRSEQTILVKGSPKRNLTAHLGHRSLNILNITFITGEIPGLAGA